MDAGFVGGHDPHAVWGIGSRRVRVLIVDDSPLFRHVARRLLDRRGYRVAGEADCVTEAVDAVERLAPDAALIDIGLPDPGGVALACHLSVAHPAIAVLLTSADTDVDEDWLLTRTGARGFVAKAELARARLTDYWPAPQPGPPAALSGS
jgi:DNA-binding NarL/FixJ family response regulator